MFRYKLFFFFIILFSLPFGNQILLKLANLKSSMVYILQQQKVQQKAIIEDGKEIYLKHCMSCHQMDGSGVPGMYPPLRKSDWVIGDKKKIISVVLNGLQGEITVNDEIYRQSMPKQDYLTDEQIAKVLTYIRQNFENKASVVHPSEVTKLRIPKPK